MSGFGLGGCAGDTQPVLLPLEPANVGVDETLSLPLRFSNPDGVSVSFAYVGPPLPSLNLTTTLTGTNTAAEFRWTPLASHVGSHQFDFMLTSSVGTSTQSVIITVTPQLGAAPVFIQPGKGGTWDLEVLDCIQFDLEVKDDDTTEVSILPAATLPQGAQLQTQGDKRARLGWCPDEKQANESLTWTLRFEADDGEHEPTGHTYTAVLRRAAKDNCPGTPPTVQVVSPGNGDTVTSSGGYPVTVKVTDDTEIRDAPILYYTTNKPENMDAPDLSGFEQQIFVESPSGGVWGAAVPPLGLEDGVTAEVWFFISAVDNDDETGTACDHRTDTAVRSFVAATGLGKAGTCDLCTASDSCESGVCSAEGQCLDSCADCEAECSSVTTIEGSSVPTCKGIAGCTTSTDPVDNDCVPDAHINPDPETALSLLGGAILGAICELGEGDFYSFTSGLDANVTFTLQDQQEHDLDLSIVDVNGNNLGVASTSNATEELSFCVSAGSTTYAKVYSYQYATKQWGSYQIEAVSSAGTCCVNDATEPDNAIEQAVAVVGTTFSGSLCPFDQDFVTFTLDQGDHVEIALQFEGAVEFVDISLFGPLPEQKSVGGALGGQGTTQFNGFLDAGTYAIAILPFGNQPGTYTGKITAGSESGCFFTFDCPDKTVCNEGTCVPEFCGVDQLCPIGHACTQKQPFFGELFCAFDCIAEVECRGYLGERCKWLDTGRGCAKAGAKTNGDACNSLEECADQSDCFTWPGGYCARVGCATNADCTSDSRCILSEQSKSVCVRTCGLPADAACRLDEGYGCSLLFDITGGTFSGCSPN